MAAANPDPIMVLVMGLFPSATVTDDGVLPANRASAQDGFRAGLGPIGLEVELGSRKWDKQNRSDEGSAHEGDLGEIGAGKQSLRLFNKVSTGKE